MQIIPRAIQTKSATQNSAQRVTPSTSSVAGDLSSTYATSTQSTSFADFMNIYSTISPRENLQSGSSDSNDSGRNRESLVSDGDQTLRQELQDRRTQLRPDEELETAAPVIEPLTSATESSRNADLNPEDLKAARNHRVEIDNQNIKMTREDLDAMRAGLKGYGLSQHELNEIETKVTSSEGLTWGQFVRTLSEKMRASSTSTKVSVTENQELQSFFQKLGYSPVQAKTQIKALSQGQASSVLASVQSALANLPQDRGLALTERELTTFMNVTLRASGAQSGTDKQQSASISSQLSQAVAQVAAAGSLPKNVVQLLSQFKTEAAQQAKDQATKDFKLVKLVGDTLKKSADRDKIWAPVDNEAQAQKTLLQTNHGAAKEIKDNAAAQRNPLTAHSRKENSDAAKQQNQQNQQNQQQVKVAAEEAAAKQAQPQQQQQQTKAAVSQEEPLDLQNAKRPAAKAEIIAAHATEHAEIKSDVDTNANANNAWNEFFGKLSAESNATLTRTDGSKPQSFAVFDTVATQNLSNANAAESAKNAAFTRAAMNQLQNAVLSNQGQGRTQLTLQLKPENLGTLSVMLQVKNKEVQAVIRAENQETGKMLAANLDSLRQSLEAQGLKVARMEVQTGLSGNMDQGAWLGQEGHNLAREQQEAMTAMKMRWRIMSGEDTSVSRDALLAQQQTSQGESGLHLVA